MEVKRHNGKQSLSQMAVQKMIEERGFDYHIVKSVDDALSVVGYAEKR
jgi:hypothetical protein